MTFICYSIGCKTNHAENETLAARLAARGHSRGAENPDVVILNTCAVTAEAERKSRQAIRRIRREHPNAKIAVYGCLPNPEGADITGDARDREGFYQKIEALFPVLPPVAYERVRTREFIKIQDGCSNSCAYCIIPSLRGQARPTVNEEIFAQVLQSDAREIVLTGTEISARRDLFELIEQIHAKTGARIRLGSLDPRHGFVPPPYVCPHFHVALQSGCDRVLRAMNREYGTAQVSDYIRRLREAFPDCTLGADWIVGFPGESGADFAESVKFIRDAGFDFLHVFPFSPREGTAARTMPQIGADEMKNRLAVSRELKKALLRQSIDRQIGRTLGVLFETDAQGRAENYHTVCAAGKRGEILPIEVTLDNLQQ